MSEVDDAHGDPIQGQSQPSAYLQITAVLSKQTSETPALVGTPVICQKRGEHK